MNPLTHFKKMRILPPLIGLALVALMAAPALATPNCEVTTSNLLCLGQSVDTAHAAHCPDGSLDLMCKDVSGWDLKTKVKGDWRDKQ